MPICIAAATSCRKACSASSDPATGGCARGRHSPSSICSGTRARFRKVRKSGERVGGQTPSAKAVSSRYHTAFAASAGGGPPGRARRRHCSFRTQNCTKSQGSRFAHLVSRTSASRSSSPAASSSPRRRCSEASRSPQCRRRGIRSEYMLGGSRESLVACSRRHEEFLGGSVFSGGRSLEPGSPICCMPFRLGGFRSHSSTARRASSSSRHDRISAARCRWRPTAACASVSGGGFPVRVRSSFAMGEMIILP
mmetsp:Transcript_98284/g.278232  ORF Transcript_98284/g.278232 Transcript_98284/m.278232 type:complete len:252 (+) Transcript_98284:1395-2150(+)